MVKRKSSAAGSKISKAKTGKAVKRRVVKKAGAPRKAALRKRPGVAKTIAGPPLEKIGKVTHYFPHVKAAAVMILKDRLKVGEEIYVKGHTTDFKQKVVSMQLDRAPIQEGKKAQEIGLLVKSRTRIGDSVYRMQE